MKLKKVILPLLAMVLLVVFSIAPELPSVMAYFTANTRAKGGYTIQLTGETAIDEDFADWTKRVTITNQKGVPIYVRARAYSAFELQYKGTGWQGKEDGWYYYQSAVEAGKSTSILNVKIEKQPAPEEETNFNVIVVYESTPVQYDTGGNPYADWKMVLDTGEEVQP